MSEFATQVVETWNIHQRITMLLLDHLSKEALATTLSTRGGRDVARQLAHMHNVRAGRLGPFARKSKRTLLEFEKGETPGIAKLKKAFKQSGALMADYLAQGVENDGAISNFKRGAIPLLGYTISHEAQHRGSILLTMKQCGVRLPQELKWGIWEWNKI